MKNSDYQRSVYAIMGMSIHETPPSAPPKDFKKEKKIKRLARKNASLKRSILLNKQPTKG